MYNPRFPHTLVVKRAAKDANGDFIFDDKGDPTYNVVSLDIVDTLDNDPTFNADGTLSTHTATSINFGYRNSAKDMSQAGDVIVSDYRLACPMFTTELLHDDVIELKDYDCEYRARLVKKITFNWGTCLWVDKIGN